MTARTVEYRRAGDLPGALTNDKGHDVEGIARSMARFGLLPELVGLDDRTGRMVGGHGRAETLAWLEADGQPDWWPSDRPFPPEGVDVDDEGRWLCPVVVGWASADDDEAAAAGIALNRLTELGGWLPGLHVTLDRLADTPRGLDGIGWTADALDDLVASAGRNVLDVQSTEAKHAEHVGRGAPAATREQQGLHEVGLMFQADTHAEYVEHLARLKRAWKEPVAALVVLRALREAQ